MNIHVPTYSRRQFLKLAGQGVLLATLPGRVWAEEMGAVTISILHTTDLHGHILPTVDYAGRADVGGLARCATQIRHWRAENPRSLLLDLGDVYQGTEFGLHNRGSTMMRCLNALQYDAWVVGNHEFDWGPEALASCVGLSAMPVLSGNARIDGQAPGAVRGPFEKIRPWVVREVDGFKLAVVGLTTPGLTSWSPPENLRGFEVLDPVESLRGMLREVAVEKPDAIILAGHMGLKRVDDFANQVGALTREFPQITVCLGAHTHQNQPSLTINRVLYSQADHYGIYAGKVDLTFDRATRKLLRREAVTIHMDHQVALDPAILALAQPELDTSASTLAQPIGELTETFSAASTFGTPSEVERLIASAIIAALKKKSVAVDAVLHGLFETKLPVGRGIKTVADAWMLLPYENEIVTVELAYADLLAIAREVSAAREPRNFMGLRVAGKSSATGFQVEGFQTREGAPLPEKPTCRLALNSYDSQSAGLRFPILGRLVARASSRRVLHAIQVRDALIDFFVERKKISRASLLV